MPATELDLWKLLLASGLVSMDEQRQLQAALAELAGPEDDPAEVLRLLVVLGAISAYQAKVLLANRAGPFVYGDLAVYDRIDSGRLAGAFRALHRASGRPVLLHFFAGPMAQDPARWQAVAERIGRAALLKHPNLARLYKLVEVDGYKYVAIEDLRGLSAAELLAMRRLSVGEACRIAADVAGALGYLHAQGTTYGDVRPQNIWITPEGKVKLLCYPLATHATSAAVLDLATAEGAERVRAGADYAAPEIIASGLTPSALTDVYALGCTLYQLIAGTPPFAGGTLAEKVARHATEPIAPLERFGAPPELSKIVSFMMAKRESVRLQSTAAVASALAPFAGKQPIDGVSAGTPTPLEQVLRDGKKPVEAAIAAAGQQACERPRATYRAARQSTDAEIHADARRSVSPVAAASSSIPQMLDDAPDFAGLATKQVHAARGRKRQSPLGMVRLIAGLALLCGIGAFIGLNDSMRNRLFPRQAGAGDPKGGAGSPIRPPPSTGPTGKSTSPQPASNTPPLATNPERPPTKKRPAMAAGGRVEQVVDDDGRMLWASPTSGRPIDVAYLPSGAQMILWLRPAALLDQAEGRRVVAALGPNAQELASQLESVVGAPVSEIESVLVGFYSQETPPVGFALVVHLLEKVPEAQLLEAWHQPAAAGGPKPFYRGREWSYYVPQGGDGRTIAIAPAAAIEQAIAAEDPLPLASDLEAMRLASDADRHLEIFATRGFLDASGKTLFRSHAEKLAVPLSVFLGDDARAAALAIQLGEVTFLELRAVAATKRDAPQLAARYALRLEQLPGEVESYLGGMSLHAHGRGVLIRMPRMLAEVAAYARTSAMGRQAVVRACLPATAAHNLLLAAELALWQQPIASAGPTSRPGQEDGPQAALARATTLSFPKDTLEHSIELLSADLGIEIRIIGKDLELEGVTRNQSFKIDERQKPAGEILRLILNKANPDGKLVYVFKPPQPGEKDIIFITTRAAAKKRGDALPAEFEKAPAGK